MKRIVFLAFYVFIVISFTSAVDYLQLSHLQNSKKLLPSELPWRLLQQAQSCYDTAKYADAFTFAQKAGENRKRECDWMLFVLNNAVIPIEVQKAGDALTDIMPILEKRESKDALEIIQSLFDKKGQDYFNNSLKRMLEYINVQREYAEADFLIGKIYRIEGEFDIAEQYYVKAWQNSITLDIPDQKYDILYELADLAMNQGKNDEYEKYLLLIVGDDPQYINTTMSSAIQRTLQDTMKGVADKFFLMYRENTVRSMEAFFKLSDIYDKRGDLKKSLLVSAYGVLTAFTHMYTIVMQRDPNYEYIGFPDFLREVKKYNDILDWAAEDKIWYALYDFAVRSEKCNCTVFSKELLTDLSLYLPHEDLRIQAKKQLANFQ